MRLNHQDCLLKGYPYYPLIPQRGVQQYVYPRRIHNVVWDSRLEHPEFMRLDPCKNTK